MIRKRSNLVAAIALGILVATGSAATAQGWYYVNGQPVAPGMGQYLMARGLPFGNYWLQPNGNWRAVGSYVAWGNIYGGHVSLSQRGRLYSAGELLR